MNVIAKRRLKEFWPKHPQAEAQLAAWYAIASRASWQSPQDIKDGFGNSVDFIGDNRVIFDIAGNKYRLIVHVAYRHKAVLITFVGTHAAYDEINPETV